MKRFVENATAVLLVSAIVVGCGQGEQTSEKPAASAPETATTTDAQHADDAGTYLLSSEPEGARDVIAVREAAGDDEDIVIVGRIGGSENPWVEGRAAFSIVDPSLKACSDIPGDSCPKPWDYCCETDKLPTSTALVKVVDGQGELVKSDARELLHVTELQTVVVRGKAKRDEDGNLTVLADGVYVRK